MDDVVLNFINRSNDNGESTIVIYQPNIASNFNESLVAWKVIENSEVNSNHLFMFPFTVELALGDLLGNSMELIETKVGRVCEIVEGVFTDELQVTDKQTNNPSEIEVHNALRYGKYSANCYRDDRLLATQEDLQSGDSVFFRFATGITIGVASEEIEEGDEMDVSILNDTETELSLVGVDSVDIVMTGGGTGPNAQPYEFKLENIKRKQFQIGK